MLIYKKSSNKIYRTLGVMDRLKRYLPTKILRVLYNYLVLPHLQYAILSWGSKISRLNKLQKRAIRVVTYSKFNAHTEPRFKSQNLLKLEDMLYVSVLKLYYKLFHGNLPAYVTNLFTSVVPGTTHDYDLRPSGIFKMPTSHTCVAERCIRFILQKWLMVLIRVLQIKFIRIPFKDSQIMLKWRKSTPTLLAVW